MTTAGILYQGTLSNSIGDLYTVPANTQAYITSIKICNVGAAARTINIKLKKSAGTARNFSDKDYSLAVGYSIEVCDNAQQVRLNAGDIISGGADAVTDCEITIMGLEVT